MSDMLVQETGAPGWAEVVLPDVVPRILIKVAEKGGRWVVADLILIGEVLDSATLKAIPMARIESLLNTPGIGNALVTRQVATSGDTPWLQSFQAEFRQVDDALTTYVTQAPRGNPKPPSASARQPLTRPDGSDPDSFYRGVAETYNSVVQETSAPAKVMADEAGVPPATVHRWIAESRRRGFLPPARKGRAG